MKVPGNVPAAIAPDVQNFFLTFYSHISQYIVMKYFKQLIVIFLLFLLAASFAKMQAASPSPQIRVMNFDELYPLLHIENDTTYVVNFWATWCAPCVREIPAFEKLYDRYKSQKVQVILVSLDFPNHLHSRLIPFVERNNVKSRVILLDDPDANRWIPMVSENWTGAIPATLIFNRNVRRFYQREFYFEELQEIIVPLLNQN